MEAKFTKSKGCNSFNSLKATKFSRFEAYFDMIANFKDRFDITTIELAKRWNWKHHSRVLYLLNHLEKKGLIHKESNNKYTRIHLLN